MPTVSINGAEIYYEEHGAGQPVLFIHGMCGSATTWMGQVDRLVDSFRCVSYDRRGHSRSSLGDITQRTVQLHADDAAALIRTLGLTPVLLVGSSGGARVGLDIVRRYPELLRGAVLSEPPAFALDPAGGTEFQAGLKPLVERAMAEGGPRRAVDAFFGAVCPGLWNVIDEERRDAFRDNAAELFGDLQMPLYEISPDDLARIRVPCLLVSGEKSMPVFQQVVRILVDNIPGAEILTLRDSGHVTYAEQPDAFAAAVRAFAARLDGVPAD